MKRIVIVGATSGIGREVACLFAQQGWIVGAAGRREKELKELQLLYPQQIHTEVIDITTEEATTGLSRLIESCGGMDVYFHASGIGKQNYSLNSAIELATIKTNGEGFVRMITAAWDYFRQKGQGHIAVISSIAGTKGLGAAPAYSATKRFQNCYLEALAQLARLNHLSISLTDIRPGFVATDLLADGKKYPLLMQKEKVARLIVQAILKRKKRVILDWKYVILVFFWRLIPSSIWERLPIRN